MLCCDGVIVVLLWLCWLMLLTSARYVAAAIVNCVAALEEADLVCSMCNVRAS